MNKKYFLLITFLIVLIPAAHAIQGEMTLLTVGLLENDSYIGNTANLHLEIKPGNGRIFMDSFPLTKVDTQISARFAKEIACNFLEMDCSNKDFFYTIRAKSSIVGGPSAGAAMTVLTISLLDDLELDKSVVITGTINSGGIIGAVSGIEEKAKAAKEKGFKKILVPKWGIIDIENATNETENVTIIYADKANVTGIEIIAVSTIEEALQIFTGKTYEVPKQEISIPPKYQEIMGKVAQTLCERYDEIAKEVNDEEKLNETKENREKGQDALESEDYYSAASYCFTSNTRARNIQFENYTNKSKERIINEIKAKVTAMLKTLDELNFQTISDLETYMIVKERLYETQTLMKENQTQVYNNLGYIYERMYSAVAWSAFFDYNEGEILIDKEHLAQACLTKLAEAEERINYIDLTYGSLFEKNNELKEIREIYDSKDYAFCLFKATKVKADANALLTTTGVTREKLPELISDQLLNARIQINKEGQRFPILGYSYYNYATSLIDSNPVMSAIFAEYATDLSDLGMYFPKENKTSIRTYTNNNINIFLFGFAMGCAVTLLLIASRKNKRARK